jgi:tetratricopeptide (TPR) repeat protein
MPKWNAFPHTGAYDFDVKRVKKNWESLHLGDAEPLPKEAKLIEAWALFHSGEFQKAALEGLKLGNAGITLANKATCIYANYLEPKERARLDLFLEVAQRAQEQSMADATNANAFYWQAYALGRYSQGISVAKALAQGIGGKIKTALEATIKLQPKHADARIALGAFHAEVIDKVGALIGGMTYGAKKEVGLRLFQEALALTPKSAIAMLEYANGLVLLEGDKRMKEATALYEQAAASSPQDAMERLDVEMAKAELAD